MKVVVVIPAFNEASSIGLVIGDLPRALVREVIVVNNASTDATVSNATAAGAIVVTEPKRGYGHACLMGIDSAMKLNPDVIVFLDGDYSDHPDELDRLLGPIISNEADFVVGSRMIGKRERGSMPPQALIGNRIACTLIGWFWGTRYTDLGPFRAVTVEALRGMEMADKTFGWTVEMQIKAAQQGLRIKEVPVSYRRRVGVSKITGTIAGTVKASAKILWTIFRFALIDRGRSRRD